MRRAIVITTINEKTKALEEFEAKKEWHVVVVGDKRSKDIPESENLRFLSVEEQADLGYQFADRCPYHHYGRKNIGYIYAVQSGAEIIYDTDDDNIPYPRWYAPEFEARKVVSSDRRFVNVYAHFGAKGVWPRGFPLDEVRAVGRDRTKERKVSVGVWQGLADRDPDVDAIFRLLDGRETVFEPGDAFALEEGVYSPFNSQNTFWHRSLFPLLYLPVTVSFRFTDILRGYIAQRIMWETGRYLGVMEATVFQTRNVHDLMKDFEDEIECYTKTHGVVSVLSTLKLRGEVHQDLVTAYEALVYAGLIDRKELDMLQAWLIDLEKVS